MAWAGQRTGRPGVAASFGRVRRNPISRLYLSPGSLPPTQFPHTPVRRTNDGLPGKRVRFITWGRTRDRKRRKGVRCNAVSDRQALATAPTRPVWRPQRAVLKGLEGFAEGAFALVALLAGAFFVAVARVAGARLVGGDPLLVVLGRAGGGLCAGCAGRAVRFVRPNPGTTFLPALIAVPTADPATSTADPAISTAEPATSLADPATDPAIFRTRLITLPETSISPTSKGPKLALASDGHTRPLPARRQLSVVASLRRTVCRTPPFVK